VTELRIAPKQTIPRNAIVILRAVKTGNPVWPGSTHHELMI